MSPCRTKRAAQSARACFRQASKACLLAWMSAKMAISTNRPRVCPRVRRLRHAALTFVKPACPHAADYSLPGPSAAQKIFNGDPVSRAGRRCQNKGNREGAMNRIGWIALFATLSLAGAAGLANAQQPAAAPPPPLIDWDKVQIKTIDLGHSTYMLMGQGGNITI